MVCPYTLKATPRTDGTREGTGLVGTAAGGTGLVGGAAEGTGLVGTAAGGTGLVGTAAEGTGLVGAEGTGLVPVPVLTVVVSITGQCRRNCARKAFSLPIVTGVK